MIFMGKSIESEQTVVATCRTSKRAFLGSMGKNRNGQPDSLDRISMARTSRAW